MRLQHKMRTIILFSLLSGCCNIVSQPETFILPQGEMIECLGYEQATCGMNLLNCGMDFNKDFPCMTDLRYVGPPEID